MPLYEFACRECGEVGSVKASVVDYVATMKLETTLRSEAPPRLLALADRMSNCPCGSRHRTLKLSTFTFHMGPA